MPPSWRALSNGSTGGRRHRRGARLARHEATPHRLPRGVPLCAEHGPPARADARGRGRWSGCRCRPSDAGSARPLARAGRARSLLPQEVQPSLPEHRRRVARPGSRHHQSLPRDRRAARQDRHRPDPARRRRSGSRDVRGIAPRLAGAIARARSARPQAVSRLGWDRRARGQERRGAGRRAARQRPRVRAALPRAPGPRPEDLRGRRAAVRREEGLSDPDRTGRARGAVHPPPGAVRDRAPLRPSIRHRSVQRRHHRERRPTVRRGHVQHPGLRRRPGRAAASRLVSARGGRARGPGTRTAAGGSPHLMASRLSETSVLRERLARSLDERREPGVTELCDALERLLDGAAASEDTIGLERLQKGVYRLRLGGGSGRTLVLKRHTPAIAHTDRLVVERWLPALGLGDRCPRLLAAAAQREGRWVWHVYEDLCCDTLADRREPPRLEAAVDLIAQLHTRGVGHPLLPEVRWHGRDHGARSWLANLRDGIAALESLAADGAPARFALARSRLLERLHRLLEEAPRHVRLMDEAEGAGHRLAADGDLNLVFHIAETARGVSCIIWPAMALLNDGAEWGWSGLVDIDDWFESLRPPLPDAVGGAA